MTFADGCVVSQVLHELTMREIIKASPCTSFGRADRRSRAHLLETVASLSISEQQLIRSAAEPKSSTQSGGPPPSKRQRVSGPAIEAETTLPFGDARYADEELFLKAPTQNTVEGCIANFIDRTSNEALSQETCMSCAQRQWRHELTKCKVVEIPNGELLAPHEFHRAHTLTQGMLLHEKSIRRHEQGDEGNLCSSCVRDLNAHKRPKLSLANGMWVGDVPPELAVLTIPEKILVARYYPAAYVIKLFPKKRGARHWRNSGGLNSAVCGNVSTFRLNTSDIAEMVDPKIIPPPAHILATVIGVTIIGPRGLPERTMPEFMRVNRSRVRNALVWLKANNDLYVDTVLSEEMLNQYPEDGVPQEIMDIMRFSDDVDGLDCGRAGYVVEDDDCHPEENIQNEGMIQISDEDEDVDRNRDGPADPMVIPLQSLGAVDSSATDMSDSELLANALAQTSESDFNESFAVKRSGDFVNEYPRKDAEGNYTEGGYDHPNHLLGCFPDLWPYGRGGPEVSRPSKVSYEAHAEWAMRYHDKRFSKHLQYMFQVFGVIQKRQVAKSTSLQISRSDFLRNQGAIRSLKPADLLVAAGEEARKVPFSNPTVRSLRKHISALRTKVMGTDESRIRIRRQIWSTIVVQGPPSLWITINPSDTHDPIAQVLAGNDIDLDNFISTSGPDSTARSRTIASDPNAASMFFHYIINVVIEELFGIRARSPQRKRASRQEGIFSKVASYVGTVEAQGRGTLHLHIVLWLCGAPTAERMRQLLKEGSFRQRVQDFIKSNIKADVDSTDINDVVQAQRENGITFSRPVDPRKEHYLYDKTAHEKKLVRAVQFHECSLTTCLIMKKNRLQCKRGAPFDKSTRDWVDEDGSWGIKRSHAYINNWNPAILHCTRSNHDIKLISNGTETKDLAFYITNYVAKKQRESSNISALFAKRYAFHHRQERYTADIQKLNKRLMQRCANSMSREQIFSAPEVASYLTNKGDRFISDFYVPIYLDSVRRVLKNAFPNLCQKKRRNTQAEYAAERTGTREEVISAEVDVGQQIMSLTVINGEIGLKDQMGEYVDRGTELEDVNYLEYFLDTYEGDPLVSGSSKGPHPSERVSYLESSQRQTKCRVMRKEGHECKPEFIGEWIPRNDNSDERELYCGFILALLMPWQDVRDICYEGNTLVSQFEAFVQVASPKAKDMMKNTQYYWECIDGAKKRREQAATESIQTVDVEEPIYDGEDYEQPHPEARMQAFTEEDVENTLNTEFSSDLQLYAHVGMQIAEDVGVFDVDEVRTQKEIAQCASAEDAHRYVEWSQKMETMSQKDPPDAANHSSELEPAEIDQPADVTAGPLVGERSSDSTERERLRPHLNLLNTEQLRAHNIIAETLMSHLGGKSPRQLLMIVTGAGGTGKSTVLNALTKTFQDEGASHLLAKTALSGVAASLIGGTTLHWWAGIPVALSQQSDDWMDKSSSMIKRRREANIAVPTFFITDEYSMMTTDLMTYSSQVMGRVKTGNGGADATVPFGGMNCVLFGDLHQLEPVGKKRWTLFSQSKPEWLEKQSSILGRNIYSQFEHVVTLTEQNRITDEVWRDILQRARIGECTKEDLKEMRQLIVTNPECPPTDFTHAPWSTAILVTTRNSMRARWNSACLRKHCESTGNIRYVCDAEDTVGREHIPTDLEQKVTIAKIKVEDIPKHLPHRIELAIGMKAMVTHNIATEADLANGSRGTIADIILDCRERVDPLQLKRDGYVKLAFPPALIVFEPYHHRSPKFDGLKEGQIPLLPLEVGFTISTIGKPRTKIHRRQYSLTVAYAFTDHKAQGQTVDPVIIDIGRVPGNLGITSFSAYVTASRGRGRGRIRFLRDFDDAIFTRHPSEYLRAEDERLSRLTAQTKERWESGFYKCQGLQPQR